MTGIRTLGFGTAVVLALVATSFAELRVAVVNMDRLILTHPQTVSDRAVLEKQVEDFEAAHADMLARRAALVEAFESARREASSRALSESARDEKQEAAEDKLSDLRAFEKEIRETAQLRQKQIADQQIRMRQRVVAKISGVVEGYVVREGIDLVLDSSETGANGAGTVVYHREAMDITGAILALTGGVETAPEEAPQGE